MNVVKHAVIPAESRPRLSETTTPWLTLFAIPKAFTDRQTRVNQTNAILSWQQLAPSVQILLFGDEPGIEEFAEEHGLGFGGGLRRNAFGTPLLSDAFARAHQLSDTPLMMYVNSDVIFSESLLAAAERVLQDSRLQPSVTFGQRLDVPVNRLLDFSTREPWRWLEGEVASRGQRSPIVCKEYFLFTRGLYESIPDFAVGRGNWDNWMIHHAREQGTPVVNATEVILAIHQKHGYRHLKTSRLGCYVTCPEAKQNQRLAGGRHLISGSCGTWRMTPNAIQENPRSRWNSDFWGDLGAFTKMVLKMPFER